MLIVTWFYLHIYTERSRDERVLTFLLCLFSIQELYELFKDYAFLWQQDVNQTFEEFLNGNVSPTLGDTSGPISPSNLRVMASARSVTSRYVHGTA